MPSGDGKSGGGGGSGARMIGERFSESKVNCRTSLYGNQCLGSRLTNFSRGQASLQQWIMTLADAPELC